MPSQRTYPLTRAEIFETALRIIDAEGIDSLTMRRLARELGVEAMSLYHHVPNKQALLDGVIELSLAAQAPPPSAVDTEAWQDVVVGAVCGFRRALVAHPNVLPHMVAHPPTSPEASAMYVQGPLRFLVEHGLPAGDASHLFEAIFALSFGHALLTTNYTAIEAEGVPAVEFTEESFEQAVRVLIDGYSPHDEAGA